MKLKLITIFFAAAISSCAPISPSMSGGDNYEVTQVTPEVISQQQELVAGKYTYSPKAEADSTYRYRIGPGDIILANIYVPKLQSTMGDSSAGVLLNDNWQEYKELIVMEDGNVTFPYVGNIMLGGKSLSEAKVAVDSALSKYFKNPQSMLTVKTFKGRVVHITGRVTKPADLYLQNAPLRVLAAIEMTGGLKDDADLTNATITHKDGTVQKVDLFALVNYGKADHNIILEDGDTLFIPANSGNKVFVMGEVNRPSMVYIKGGRMTALEAISSSNGANAMTTSYGRLYVIRGAVKDVQTADAEGKAVPTVETKANPLQTQIFHIDASNGPGIAMAANFPLQPNDVVYVSPVAITEWNRFITQLLPYSVTNAATVGHNW